MKKINFTNDEIKVLYRALNFDGLFKLPEDKRVKILKNILEKLKENKK